MSNKEKNASPEPLPAMPTLHISRFFSGLVLRVRQTFRDFDGNEVRSGETLSFLEGSYFPYESGHTLRFLEKTVRLAGVPRMVKP